MFCSYLKREKSSSQIVGARNKTMTAISCQKNSFAAIFEREKIVHKSLEQDKRE